MIAVAVVVVLHNLIVIAHNLGSSNVILMINHITLSIFSPSIGFLKLSQPLDMEIMLVQPQMSTSFRSHWNLWDLHSSLS